MDEGPDATRGRTEALRATYAWFERHSGWAPPDEDTLADWVADGLSRCPDDCLIAYDGWCDHGLASWWLLLRDLEQGGPGTRPRGSGAP